MVIADLIAARTASYKASYKASHREMMMRYRCYMRQMGSSALAVVVSAGLAVAAGCDAEDSVLIGSERFTMPSDEVLAQETAYMAQLFDDHSNGQPFIKLDLRDQRQYAFFVHRLLRAGNTPFDSPRLFERLAELRTAPPRSAGPANAAGGGGARCGHFLIASGSVNAGTYNLTASALMSCFNGMDFVALDQAIFETNEDETSLKLLAVNSVENFIGIEVRTPVLRAGVAAQAGRQILADSIGFASDEATGETEATFTKYKTEADAPATIRANNGQASCALDHPRDNTGDGLIRLCYQRSFTAGLGDCDYVAVNALNLPGVPPFTHIAQIELVAGLYLPSLTTRWPIPNGPVNAVPNLFLPMMGTFDAGTRLSNGNACRIQGLKQEDTWAALHLRTTGGWCAGAGSELPDDGGQLFRNLRTNLSSLSGNNRNVNDLPFGEDAANPLFVPNLLVDFGPDCLQNLQDACLVVSISARTNCNDNDPSIPGNTRTATCEVCFDVRNSCFAAGTVIRRADGTTAPIETIAVGDRIIASGTGTPLTVTATSRGVEPEPMVRLKDSLGHELMLTAKHPVITTRGPMPADQITPMSQVETEDGVASIVAVERVRYEGMVYNVSVGTPDEIAMVSGINRTLFAGGIRVGDNEMQFDMEREALREKTQRANAARAASPVWAIDRFHATVRGRLSAPPAPPGVSPATCPAPP
jgi:hypothetical protein